MFQALVKNSRIKYGKNFLEFFESPVHLLDKTPLLNFLHAFWNILEHSACILEHSACILELSACIVELSACILEHSGTFWKAYVTACKLTYSFALHLFPVLYCLVLSCIDSVCVHSFELVIATRTDGQTDRQTYIRTC